eukprot:TRINITY_DN1727_c0_g1_i4.p1 TRINITY_DN1727_c0_g1~~TRINITY_DN1727_c0_g1_i4.p1  ORF type:complete len:223 (-),score=48.30 TRINITY_DN1727_c0_g1_i4:45-713(-)
MSEQNTTQWPQVHVLRNNNQIQGLHTIIRDKSCPRDDFLFYSNRLIRLLVEEALSFLPFKQKIVKTHTGSEYNGVEWECKICGVSIVRAGESMEASLSAICKDVRIGKILIQRDEETALPKLYYYKFPPDLASRHILLLDPLLATGGSANQAIDLLIENGVPEENIIFCNLIAAPEGINALIGAHPKVTIVTTAIDEKLNEVKFVVPGIGDFGDRYFGTDAD